MTKGERETQLQIGKLILEQSVLEKQIGKLRDELSRRATVFARIGRLLIFQPEQLVFEGQKVDEQFKDRGVRGVADQQNWTMVRLRVHSLEGCEWKRFFGVVLKLLEALNIPPPGERAIEETR